MGNCCPCNKYLTKTKKNKKYSSIEHNRNLLRIIKSPDDFIIYGTLRDNLPRDYFSPHCTRRPHYAKKECKNCEGVFYSYNQKDFCSNECKFTVAFLSESEPRYISEYYSN